MVRFLVLLLICSPLLAQAYEVREADQSSPFELTTIEDVEAERWFVGRLNDFPHTYEFSLDAPATLSLRVMVPPSADKSELASLIVIREVTRGVEEVARRTAENEVWDEYQDPVSRVTLQASPSLQAELSAGVYRVEVSNPDNYGVYVLAWGSEDHTGYLGKIYNAVKLRSLLEVPVVGVVQSKYVYMPLLIMMSFSFCIFWWRRRGHVDKLTEG